MLKTYKYSLQTYNDDSLTANLHHGGFYRNGHKCSDQENQMVWVLIRKILRTRSRHAKLKQQRVEHG